MTASTWGTEQRGYCKRVFKAWPHTFDMLEALRVLAINDEERERLDVAQAAMLAEDRAEQAARRFVRTFQNRAARRDQAAQRLARAVTKWVDHGTQGK